QRNRSRGSYVQRDSRRLRSRTRRHGDGASACSTGGDSGWIDGNSEVRIRLAGGEATRRGNGQPITAGATLLGDLGGCGGTCRGCHGERLRIRSRSAGNSIESQSRRTQRKCYRRRGGYSQSYVEGE